jgi:chromosome segregation ATPase
MDPAASVEAQLKAIRQNVERLNEQLNRVDERVDTEFDKLKETLREEQQARTESDKALDRKLEKAQTGGLHVAFAGVILLFVGLVLSTLSPEIAQLRGP